MNTMGLTLSDCVHLPLKKYWLLYIIWFNITSIAYLRVPYSSTNGDSFPHQLVFVTALLCFLECRK
jgi:hypothetical protein